MGQWAVVIPQARLESERLFHHETLEVAAVEGGQAPASGDAVLVVADDEGGPHVVALGRVVPPQGAAPGDVASEDPDAAASGTRSVVVSYTRRLFDHPTAAERLALAGPVTAVDSGTFDELAARLAPAVDNRTWLVSLDLPIEAPTQAEAVRLFWSYVMELGPRELPAFVSPSGDELAMQAFVLGEEANLDPEEDD